MWTFKRTLQEAFDTGGILLLGLGSLFLFRQQYYPNVLGPLSFGMILVGALGFVRHLVSSRTENSKYQEILILLEQRQSEIEANRCMLEELRDSCSRFMAMREIFEAWQGDPSLIEDRVAILAKIFEPREVATSRGSIQVTPTDVQFEPLAAESQTVTENTAALSSEDTGVTKHDVEQEQTGRNLRTSIEQAIEVQPNISASLECHATVNNQKEETLKQYSEITDVTKQQDPENICDKMTEVNIVKQEDRGLKDTDKTAEDCLECVPEEVVNLSKNEVQSKEFLMKESDESNQQEESLEVITVEEIQLAMEKSGEVTQRVEEANEIEKEVEQTITSV